MSRPQAKLTLTFDTGYGESYQIVMPVDDTVARDFQSINPPIKHSVPFLPGAVPLDSFEQVVDVMRRREFRKDTFTHEARRLGTLLAERMEDAEGWHDTSRIEPAKEQLRGQYKPR